MSRLYRLRIEVAGRDNSIDERAAVWDAAIAHFPDAPDEEDYSLQDGEGRHLFAFEGEHSLGGGQSEREAHDIIRSNFGGRAVSTKWWYLERDPDCEFDDAEDGGA